MKCLLCLFVLLVACAPDVTPDISESQQTLMVKVNAHRQGVKVYDKEEKYVGLSPVTMTFSTVVRHDQKTGITRYFIEGEEVHPGEKWPLKLRVYMDGFPEEMTVMVPFKVGSWSQEVTVEKKVMSKQ